MHALPLRSIELSRAAQVWATGDKVAQSFIGRLGKADADAFADGLDSMTIVADPKLLIGKQI
jgi:hypothetical protein